MEYLSIQDVSNNWNISKRRIQVLCNEGRIVGAKKIGNMWVIPENAEKPSDARKKDPIIRKKVYSEVRLELKTVLKLMYKRTDSIGISADDKKLYILSILAGSLCIRYIESVARDDIVYAQLYKDIAGKNLEYVIDNKMIEIASDYISKYQNDDEIESIVSWAYQYSNNLDVSSDFSKTQFFTERYMICYLINNIKELASAKRILDPCLGGGNFLVECLERLCSYCTNEDIEECVINQAKKLFGYDIDEALARIAVVNIRIKALSLLKRKEVRVSFDIWNRITPTIYSNVERDMIKGSLAKDCSMVCNVLSGECIEISMALGNVDVVVTNPPFSSIKGMEARQKYFLKENYPLANCDTCVAFMEAIGSFLKRNGVCGIVSQNAWMFLRSFQKARDLFVKKYKFRDIVNLGSGAFIDLNGEKSNISLLIFENRKAIGGTVRVQNYSMEPLIEKVKKLEAEQSVIEIAQESINGENGFVFSESQLTSKLESIKEQYSSYAVPMQGTSTGNSKELVGYFWEHFGDKEWIPVSNGGGYCRWEGLNYSVVKWGKNGEYIKNQKGSALRNVKYFDETQLVFSDTGTAGLNVRILLDNQIFIASGPGIRLLDGNKYAHMALLNSRFAANYVRTISPKITIAAGYIGRIPIKSSIVSSTILEGKARRCVELKCNMLEVRPNNMEYAGITQLGKGMSIRQYAWDIFKKDLLNELQKLELESQCDEVILDTYELNADDRKVLTEMVGECAFNIKEKPDVDVQILDKYFAKLLDEACMLKRSRTVKASLGCDGVLEFVSKDLNINPASLVEKICEKPDLMRLTVKKYENLVLHNCILHILEYSASQGVVSDKVDTAYIIEKMNDICGSEVDVLEWVESSFSTVHSGIFKKKPFICFEDGVIKLNGR